MSHQQTKEQLNLLLYDELDEKQRLQMKEHLKTCRECQGEFEELKRLHAVLGRKRFLEPPERLLTEARLDLQRALDKEQSFWQRHTRVPWSSPLRFALPSAVVAGVFIGYVIFALTSGQGTIEPAGPINPDLQGDLQITNLQFLDSDVTDGKVDLLFDVVRPVHMRGEVHDEPVRRVLAHALSSEQNPGVRLKAVKTIGAYLPQVPDQEVRKALIEVLKFDENPGVRKRALDVLLDVPFDEDIKDAFLHVLLHDETSGLRISAIDGLEQLHWERHGPDSESLIVLEQKTRLDDNDYIRSRAESVLKGVQLQ